MAKRKIGATRMERLPGESELSHIYGAAGSEPPPALDAKILAAARAAVRRPRFGFGARWAPLSVAAVIVLSVTVVMRLSHEGALDPPAPRSAQAPAEYYAEQKQAKPDTTKRYAPATAHPGASQREARDDSGNQARAAPELDTARGSVQREGRARSPTGARTEEAATAAQKALRSERPASPSSRAEPADAANVVSVTVTGQPGAYEFTVGIQSPDQGCGQYADWWEVVSADGALLYRRVFTSPHREAQPFVSSGGPVPIQPETVVWLRAHLNTGGYGGIVFRGSPASGFERAAAPENFAGALAQQPPLPRGCGA